MENVFGTAFVILLMLAIIFLLISVLLFFKFDIRGIWALKSGKAVKKSIQEIEESVAMSGNLRNKKLSMVPRDSMELSRELARLQAPVVEVANYSEAVQQPEQREIYVPKPSVPSWSDEGAGATSLLDNGENEATTLLDEGANQTTLLGEEVDQTTLLSQDSYVAGQQNGDIDQTTLLGGETEQASPPKVDTRQSSVVGNTHITKVRQKDPHIQTPSESLEIGSNLTTPLSEDMLVKIGLFEIEKKILFVHTEEVI
jgi:hypothetical protein